MNPPVRRPGIVLAALLAAYLLQCAWFIRTQSLTYDEPVHIAEGLDAWRHGRFEQYNDHPPLARLFCALPLISENWKIDLQPHSSGFRIEHIAPSAEGLAWRARGMNVLLGLALALLLWSVAGRLFSPDTAHFVLALFAFSPSLIAHFSLATTDGAAVLLIFASAWGVVRHRADPTWRRTVLVGVVLGLLLLAKFSTVVMFALALFWILVLGRDKIMATPFRWNWGRAALALLVAALVLWAGYFFHVSHLTIRDHQLTSTFPRWDEPIRKTVSSTANVNVWVPAGEYVEGFRTLVRHNAQGQAAFFLGRISKKGGWKAYYPVTILLKWPTAVLILSLTGLLLVAAKKIQVPADLCIMASFPLVYLTMAIFANFNIGERHILPIYPFALLLAGLVWKALRGNRVLRMLLLSLLVISAADALRSAPGYLSYFNVFVRPAEAYRLLSDSNLDWGQGLLAVRNYERDHPNEQVWLAYFGSVNPAIYGIKARPLQENERVRGTIIVSATNLSGQFLEDRQGYLWLGENKPAGILDGSMYVFRVGTF
jgi:4-amino-4-deoxy-L-arabinose transferase-like glycosyltransferase